MRSKLAAFLFVIAGAIATMEGTLTMGQAPQGTTTTSRIRPRGAQPELAVAPGWSWLMTPQPLDVGRSFGVASDAGIVSGYSHVDRGGGGLRIFFVQAGPSPRIDAPAYRLVVFDAAGKRFLPRSIESGGQGTRDTKLSNATFVLRPEILPPAKAAYVAAERVTPRGR